MSSQFEHDEGMIVAGARYAAYRKGRRDMALVLHDLMSSPLRPSRVKKKLLKEDELIPYKLDEALSLILDLSLSKEQYKQLRIGANRRKAALYPLYEKVAERKAECRPNPDFVYITESIAKVELQALLDHTVSRILTLQHEVN